MKALDENHSQIITGHKYKDKDNDNDKDKDTDEYDDRYLTMVILFMPVTLVTLFRSYNQFYRAECITVSGFFLHNTTV